jgi:hypothetical protein
MRQIMNVVNHQPHEARAMIDTEPVNAASGASPSIDVLERQRTVEYALIAQGVFKGAHGLEGLLNAKEFWESQPYGTRHYYGDGLTDYLHVGVLRAAIEALRSHVQATSIAVAESDSARR